MFSSRRGHLVLIKGRLQAICRIQSAAPISCRQWTTPRTSAPVSSPVDSNTSTQGSKDDQCSCSTKKTPISSHPSRTRSKGVIITSQVSKLSKLICKGNLEMPPFSSLNADVIPTPRFIESLETHQPKFDPELIKEIWKTIGLQTSDERLFKLGSAMLEI